MLAPLLIASLVACLLLMLVGWALDNVGRPSDVGASCPFFPITPRRPRRPSRVAIPLHH